MSQQTRARRVEYGGVVIGDATTQIDGPFILELDPDQGHLEVSFIQTPTATDAAFKAKIDALGLALTDPRAKLEIIQSVDGPDVVLLSVDPTAATGFHQAPTLTAPGDDVFDTENTLRWTFRCDFLRPADAYDNAGRRDSSVRLDFNPGKVRTIVVSGEYRADPSDTSSRSQFRAAIDSYISSIITDIGGGVFEEIGRSEIIDDIDKIATFEVTIQEINLDQSAGAFDNPTLFDQEFLIARVIRAPGDSPGDVRRLEEIQIDYRVSVDSTIIAGSALKGTYDSIVRPWILAYIARVYGSPSIAVVEERPEFDGQQSVIRVSMTVQVLPASALLALSVKIRMVDEVGIRLRGVYGSGGRLQKHRFPGPGSLTRMITEIKTFPGETELLCGEDGIDVSSPGGGSDAQRSRGGRGAGGTGGSATDKRSGGAREGGEKKDTPTPGGEGGGGVNITQLMMTIVEVENRRIGTIEDGFVVTDQTTITMEECLELLEAAPAPAQKFRELTGGIGFKFLKPSDSGTTESDEDIPKETP